MSIATKARRARRDTKMEQLELYWQDWVPELK
jgi:hypothetical protein